MIKRTILFLLLAGQWGCASQSRLISDAETTVIEEKLSYYLYYPENYEVTDKNGYGILVFLHGGGESGGQLNQIKKNGPPKLLVEGKEFPFLILAPQNPHIRQWWNVRAVNQLVDTIVANNNVDSQRIYLTGLSRGGSAAWDLAVQYPNKWAALAVVCGMAPVPYADWIAKDLPVWVFHGAEDAVIPVDESDKMVKRLKEMNYEVRYTRYDGIGHNSWDRAYTTEELYEWLVVQRKQDN